MAADGTLIRLANGGSVALSLAVLLALALASRNGGDRPEPPVSEPLPAELTAAEPLRVESDALPPPPAAPTSTVEPSAAEPAPSVPAAPPLPEPTVLADPAETAPEPAPDLAPEPDPPLPEAALVPMAEMPPPARETEPASLPPAQPSTFAPATADARGRGLLRLAEAGRAPGIELAWPPSPAAREALGGWLVECIGMRLAWRLPTERLRLTEGDLVDPVESGFSAFLREPGRSLTVYESRLLPEPAPPGASPVRLFPRAFDARLFGGLADRLGQTALLGAKSIRAGLRLEDDRLIVDSLSLDRQARPGRIDLVAGSTCRSPQVP